MPFSKTTSVAASLLVFALVNQGNAQNVTVQQPVISNFSVGTTVSVPDRGGAYIGGVSSASAARNRFGFWRGGTSTGFEHRNSAMSVHVRIHDFEAMDQYLLNSASSTGRQLTGRAGNAYRSLYLAGRRRSSRLPIRTSTSSAMFTTQHLTPDAGRSFKKTPSTSENAANARAARYLQLGADAERRGTPEVAKLHYHLAAKYGSQEAAEKLAAFTIGEQKQVKLSN